MKFLADENVDKPIVEHLRKDGHIVFYVIEMEPSISDDKVIQRANQESAILLTSESENYIDEVDKESFIATSSNETVGKVLSLFPESSSGQALTGSDRFRKMTI